MVETRDVVLTNKNIDGTELKDIMPGAALYTKVVGGWDASNRRTTQLGYLGWRPAFLESFNKAPYFVLVFGLSNFFMVMSFAIFSPILSTLESVFNLNSKQTGLILMANDISGMIAAVVLANYCSSRKVRCIAMGMWVVVIACLIPASTTLFVEYPQPKSVTDTSPSNPFNMGGAGGLCNETVSNKGDNSEGLYAVRNHRYYLLLVLGSFLQGIGTTPPGIAGSTYMDEIFTQKHFGIAIAMLYIVSFIGFPVSIIAGSSFLSYYVTLNPPPGLTPDSKEWVGAWWLGLLVPALLIFILSFILLLFPQQMPAAKKVLQDKIKRGITTAQEKKTELNRSLAEITKDTIPAFKRLLKKKALDFLVIGDCFTFLQIGSISFYPKIYSIVYRISPPVAGNILGMSNIVGFAIGLLMGGYILNKREWKAKKLQLIYSVLTLAAIPFSLALFLYCPSNTYAGVDVDYPAPVTYPLDLDLQTRSLHHQCNKDCECSTAFYRPVCDTFNQLTYFSPCHAGCFETITAKEDQTGREIVVGYHNCTCAALHTVVAGDCGDPCTTYLWISTVLTTLGTAINFAGFCIQSIIYQRIVSEVDRTLAQGFRQTATRALGTLPSPLIFGWMLDKCCSVWREAGDGTVGNCWVYDVDTFMVWFILICAAIRVLSCVFYFLAWRYYPAHIETVYPEKIEEKIEENFVLQTKDKYSKNVEKLDQEQNINGC